MRVTVDLDWVTDVIDTVDGQDLTDYIGVANKLHTHCMERSSGNAGWDANQMLLQCLYRALSRLSSTRRGITFAQELTEELGRHVKVEAI